MTAPSPDEAAALLTWARIMVRSDVTDWERKFCISVIAADKRGRKMTDRQFATLRRMVEPFRARALASDEVSP
jgi:hypothetical protein